MTQENIPPIYCSACGQKNAGDANFCIKCGKQIISTVTAQSPSPGAIPPATAPEVSAQKSSGIVTAMAVVGFVFGLIGMLGSFIPIIGIFTIKICIGAAIISGLSVVIALAQNAKRAFPIAALTISLIGVGMIYVQINKLQSATESVRKFAEEMQTNQSHQQYVQQKPMQQLQENSQYTSGSRISSKGQNNKMIEEGGRLFQIKCTICHGADWTQKEISVSHDSTFNMMVKIMQNMRPGWISNDEGNKIAEYLSNTVKVMKVGISAEDQEYIDLVQISVLPEDIEAENINICKERGMVVLKGLYERGNIILINPLNDIKVYLNGAKEDAYSVLCKPTLKFNKKSIVALGKWDNKENVGGNKIFNPKMIWIYR